MAQILIYKSDVDEGSAGLPVSMELVQNTVRESVPFRIIGPGGDIRNIAYEFMLVGAGGSSDQWSFEWFQEFYGDAPFVVGGTPSNRSYAPSTRNFPGASSATPWAREQVEVVGAAGIIDHYNVTRRITNMAVNTSRWFPMIVQGLWARLKITLTSSPTGKQVPILYVWAHVGAHAAEAELAALTKPYQYNFDV